MTDTPADVFINIIFSIIQTTMFFFSAICLLLGTLMLIFPLFKSAGDRKVLAKIVAIRAGSGKEMENGAKDMYYPVYEYKGQDGQLIQAESDWGSSSLTDKIIGTQATVTVNPAQPNKVKTFSVIMIVLALFFIGAGSGLGFMGLNTFEITPYTYAALALGFVFLVRKISKAILPKEQRKTKEVFMKESTSKRQALPILENHQIRKMLSNQTALAQTVAKALVAIGLILCGGSYYLAAEPLDLQRNGIGAEGTVVGYETVSDQDGTYYQPKIEYRDQAQTSHVFTNSYGTKLQRYSIGERVQILYLPEGKAMIKGDWLRWIIPAFLAFCGIMSFVSALSTITKSRRI